MCALQQGKNWHNDSEIKGDRSQRVVNIKYMWCINFIEHNLLSISLLPYTLRKKKKKRNKNLSILMEALSLRYLLFSVLSRCKDCIKYFPLLSIPKLFINQRFYVLSC